MISFHKETIYMKTVGLLGGMSWESTASYYRIMNEEVRDRLGGLHSAQTCLFSVEFGPVQGLMADGNWEGVTEILSGAARKVEAGGADFLLICTNTMHKLAPEIQKAISIPILHIADACADALSADGVKCAGLLGTRPTMEQDFCRVKLGQRGIDLVTPSEADMDFLQDVIFSELCAGIFTDETKQRFRDIMAGLVDEGAEGMILGCTEIPLIVGEKDCSVKLYDTTRLHALAAVEKALS